MKKIAALFFLLTFSLTSVAQSPLMKQWDRRYGGIGNDIVKTVEQTKDDGFILGGDGVSQNTGDKSQPSWGSWDYWIVKVDSLGNKMWDKRFGGNSFEDFTDLAQASDGGYLIAGTSSSPISGDKTQSTSGVTDFWVVKINSLGIKEWDKRYGGNKRENLTCLAGTMDKGYILGGSTASGISGDVTALNWDTTLQTGDYWIIKIDSAGNRQWDKRYGGLKNDLIHSIQQTKDKGYILGGQSNSGISGDKSQTNCSSWNDFWLIKIDSAGNKQWDRRFGTNSVDDFAEVIQTKEAGYILIGYSLANIECDKSDTSRGILDYWVIKIDSLGNKQWDKTYGASESEWVRSVVQTRDGGYLISGDSPSPMDGDKTENNMDNESCWLVKVDSGGTIQWEKTIQTPGGNYFGYAIQTTDGSIVMAACNNGGIGGDKSQTCWDSLPAHPDMSYDTDYWIIKYNDTTNYCHLEPVTISGNSNSICIGDSVSICAPQGFSHYAWSNGMTTPCFYARVAGNYYVTVTDENSCTSESNQIEISAYPIPQVSVSQSNDTLIASTAKSYEWYINGSVISGATLSYYIPVQAGSYSVMITDSNGCMATSNPIVITSIEEIESNNIRIYPNPVIKDLNLKWRRKQVDEVLIYNIGGQVVYKEVKPTGNRIDVSELVSGTYVAEIRMKGKVERIRWMKM
ncbi:MAG TPA: T9SS type A sorting domain-containing protein [Chitinophagales bacterium]|nr:T9SS type A sorting domain-containing protein [Chitinophagales bacterium]